MKKSMIILTLGLFLHGCNAGGYHSGYKGHIAEWPSYNIKHKGTDFAVFDDKKSKIYIKWWGTMLDAPKALLEVFTFDHIDTSPSSVTYRQVLEKYFSEIKQQENCYVIKTKREYIKDSFYKGERTSGYTYDYNCP